MGIFKFFRNKEKKNDSDLSPNCKTDDKINYEITVKKVLDEIVSETEIPCIKIELTDHKTSVFESKAGGIGYVPRDLILTTAPDRIPSALFITKLLTIPLLKMK